MKANTKAKTKKTKYADTYEYTKGRISRWIPALLAFCMLMLVIYVITKLNQCTSRVTPQLKSYDNNIIPNYNNIILSNTIYNNINEGFQNDNVTNDNGNNINDGASKEDIIKIQQKYILDQIRTDPNKTNLDKDVMEDLTLQYFSSSNTLPLLRDFNKKADESNPVAGGNQLIRDILRNYNASDS